MGAHDSLTFSDDQQAGLLGHSLKGGDTFDNLTEMGLSRAWWNNPRLVDVFDRTLKFKTSYGRWPSSPEELMADFHDAPEYKRALERSLAWCETSRALLDLETLTTKVVLWAKSRVLNDNWTETLRLHNEGKVEEALALVTKAVEGIDRIDGVLGSRIDTFGTSAEREEGEEEERHREKYLSFGVSALDDAMGGIINNDLILLGGRSSGGKTQIAKAIAEHNASLGHDVYAFFLEAEYREIERRRKYEYCATRWRADHPDLPRGIVNYPDFRMSRLDKVFTPYAADAKEYFRDRLAHMHTFYRRRGDFGPHDLVKKIRAVRDKARLIIIDHFNYIDLEGEKDENIEAAHLAKTIRHQSLDLGIPHIVVAHIKKPQGALKTRALCPDQEDFHGTSNLVKVATGAVMIGRASGWTTSDPSLTGTWGTFVRPVKVRLDASRTFYTPLCFYDSEQGKYRDKYALGELSNADTEWNMAKTIPMWAGNATVRDIVDAS